MRSKEYYIQRYGLPVLLGTITAGSVALGFVSWLRSQPVETTPAPNTGVAGGSEQERLSSTQTPNFRTPTPTPSEGCWTAGGIAYFDKGERTPYTNSECLGNGLWKITLPNGNIAYYQGPSLPPLK